MMRKAKSYNEQSDTEQQSVNEPVAAYGNIDALKVQLVKRIMRMDELSEVKSVLEFVEGRNDIERAISGEELLSRIRPRIKMLFK